MPQTRKDEVPILVDEREITGCYVESDGYTVPRPCLSISWLMVRPE
jgi:hypothetical protein